MKNYQPTNKAIWTGRKSNSQLYFHEKVHCIDLEDDVLPKVHVKSFGILGYACDEGVYRNQGRVGAVEGPDAIRKMMPSLSNHFSDEIQILDVGNITCESKNLESTQEETSDLVEKLIKNDYFPIIFGGGHDLAYAHYNGIKRNFPDKTIGIINLDAHFDLRKVTNQGNSGTPFYQIAKESRNFKYLCLGIQKASNNRELYQIAKELNVQYIENTEFNIENSKQVNTLIEDFMSSVDHIYLTIDLDGFSSAYAPGVSAPSAFGFSLDIATRTIEKICKSRKLISTDIVELNPTYDRDNCTARLAAKLAYQIMTWL